MLDKTEKLLFYYENLVNWKKRLSSEGPFICKILKEADAKKVLDAGCGIGKHVLYLRKEGFDAHGADLNPLHFNRAKELACNEDPEAVFFHEDMKTLENQGNETYDAVLTLGNTISSMGFEGAAQVFATFYRVLKPGGMMMGQVLNYDSFNREDFSDVRSAFIEGKEIINIKTFHFEEDHVLVLLNAVTKTDEKWESMVSATKMYQLGTEFVEKTLAELGFENIRFYGSLKGDPFVAGTSKDMVFVAVKKG